MVELDVGGLAQLGAAGLIGWMWLVERRSAGERERQLQEAHERLMAERATTAAVMELVRENTRALALLEGNQRRIAAVLDRVAEQSAAGMSRGCGEGVARVCASGPGGQ